MPLYVEARDRSKRRSQRCGLLGSVDKDPAELACPDSSLLAPNLSAIASIMRGFQEWILRSPFLLHHFLFFISSGIESMSM